MFQTPARAYAALVGATLVLAGILGFAWSASFGKPGDVDAVLGLLDVNAWHNIVHLATGGLGLLALRYGASGVRTYALGLGVVYIAVAVWGFVLGGDANILGFLPVNTEDDVLHAALGVLGVAAGAASPVTADARGAAGRTTPALG